MAKPERIRNFVRQLVSPKHEEPAFQGNLLEDWVIVGQLIDALEADLGEPQEKELRKRIDWELKQFAHRYHEYHGRVEPLDSQFLTETVALIATRLAYWIRQTICSLDLQNDVSIELNSPSYGEKQVCLLRNKHTRDLLMFAEVVIPADGTGRLSAPLVKAFSPSNYMHQKWDVTTTPLNAIGTYIVEIAQLRSVNEPQATVEQDPAAARAVQQGYWIWQEQQQMDIDSDSLVLSEIKQTLISLIKQIQNREVETSSEVRRLLDKIERVSRLPDTVEAFAPQAKASLFGFCLEIINVMEGQPIFKMTLLNNEGQLVEDATYFPAYVSIEAAILNALEHYVSLPRSRTPRAFVRKWTKRRDKRS